MQQVVLELFLLNIGDSNGFVVLVQSLIVISQQELAVTKEDVSIGEVWVNVCEQVMKVFGCLLEFKLKHLCLRETE